MKYLIFGILLCISWVAWAGLDESVLYTTDKKCAIRYLTNTPKSQWFIKTNQTCPNGWVSGHTTVQIYSSDHQLKEILDGFFLDGYWLDRFPAQGQLQDRNTPQENVQALTYILDEEEGITYAVQLRANRPENGIYSAFQGCPIFRLLAITKNKQLFQNDVFQDRLATKALSYARQLCSELETVAVFGTTQKNARANDIVFQMQIDPKTKKREVIPITTDFQNGDINEPLELRQESGTVLMTVEPQEEQLQIQYDPPLKTISKIKKQPKPLPLTSLMYLDVQSRLTNQPAVGRVIVHIKEIRLDGSAQVDLPLPVLLKYHPRLKMGWAVIQGRFYQNQMQVNEISFCQQEWCADVS